MDQKLFRQQALDQHTGRLYGRVLVLPHITHQWVMAGLLIWLAAAGLWLYWASYTDKKIIQTYLIVAPAVQSEASVQAVGFQVPAYAAAVLHEGEMIAIHYDAFPYQIYGSDTGEILTISELNAAKADVHELRYQVTVNMQPTQIRIKGKPLQLRNGMGISTEILLGRQPLIAWLFSQDSGAL